MLFQGIDRWMFIFCTKMNTLGSVEGPGYQLALDTKMSSPGPVQSAL